MSARATTTCHDFHSRHFAGNVSRLCAMIAQNEGTAFAGETPKPVGVFAPTGNRWSEVIFIMTGDSGRKWRTALANFAESAPFPGPAGERLFPKCFESPPLIFDAGQKAIRDAGGKSALMMPA